MSIFDDIVDGVQNVIVNPVPIIVGTVVGGAVGGSIGATIGAAGATETVAEVAQAAAKAKYVADLNNAIADTKAATPNYEALAPIWTRLTASAFQAAYKEKYGDLCPLPAVLDPMISIDVDTRRKSLSLEEYHKELDNIHNASVQASVEQLEHERDKPDEQDKPAAGDHFAGIIGVYFVAVASYLSDRFKSNFEGAGRESGVGAQILRGGVGISIKDMKEYGLLGGDNSYLRRIIPTWSDGGGLFGGDNSFFRKPFG